MEQAPQVPELLPHYCQSYNEPGIVNIWITNDNGHWMEA